MLPRRHFLSRVIGRIGSSRLQLEWLARSERLFGEREYSLLPYLADKSRPSVDIGAAEGAYTYWLAQVSRNVVAFEPNPESFRFLSGAFKSFGNVKIVNAAISNHAGEVTLRVPVMRIGGADRSLALSGWGTIDERNQFPGLSSIATVEHRVNAMTPEQAIPPDVGFIKIDVEGHEGEILASLPDAVWQAQPILLVEVGASDRGSSLREVHERLTSKGYLVLVLGARGLRCLPKTFAPDLSVNIIAIPSP